MRRPKKALFAATVLVALPVGPVFAQRPPAGAPAPDPASTAGSPDGMSAARSARHLLRNGQDYLVYQDYRRALKYLREAEARLNQLTPDEQRALKQALEQAQAGLRVAANAPGPRYAKGPARATAPGALAVARPPAGPAPAPGHQAPANDPIQLVGGTAEAPFQAPTGLGAPIPVPAPEDAPATPPMPIDPAAAPAMPTPAGAPGQPFADAPPLSTFDPAIDALPGTTRLSDPAPVPVPDPAAEAVPPPIAVPAPASEPTAPEPAPGLDLPPAEVAAPSAAEPSPPAFEPPALIAAEPPAPAFEPSVPIAAEPPAPAFEPSVPAPTPAADPAFDTPGLVEPAAEMPLPSLPEIGPGPGPGLDAAPAFEAAPASGPADGFPAMPDQGGHDLPALPGLPAEAAATAPDALPQPGLDPALAGLDADDLAPAPTPSPESLPPLPDDLAPRPAFEPPPPPEADELPPLPVDGEPATSADATPPAPSTAAGPDPAGAPAPGQAGPFAATRVFADYESSLTPEQRQRVEQIAAAQETEALSRPLPLTDTADPNRPTTRLELPRAPSPTEARPIRAIPVPDDFVPLPPREWSPSRKYWAAAATCHGPLYFQDAALERYGHSVEQFFGPKGRFLTYPLDDPRQSKLRNQILQPFFSAGLFAAQIVAAPYNMVVDPPWEPEYDLGYYRPGDRIPTDVYYLPLHGVGPPLRSKDY